MLLEMFKQMTPEDEQKLARRVEEKGGAHAVRENDKLLREFLDGGDDKKRGGRSGPPGKDQTEQVVKSQGNNSRPDTRNTSSYSMDRLRADLHEDWDDAVKSNLAVFEGKFALQQRQIQEELSRFIRDENNRVIDAVSKGPHDLIKHEVSSFASWA